MRNLVIGFIIGMILGGSIAYAATRATLQNGSGVEIGTATSPIYIQGV
jgi:hypothetical protein